MEKWTKQRVITIFNFFWHFERYFRLKSFWERIPFLSLEAPTIFYILWDPLSKLWVIVKVRSYDGICQKKMTKMLTVSIVPPYVSPLRNTFIIPKLLVGTSKYWKIVFEKLIITLVLCHDDDIMFKESKTNKTFLWKIPDESPCQSKSICTGYIANAFLVNITVVFS